jgi:hypothetical protein
MRPIQRPDSMHPIVGFEDEYDASEGYREHMPATVSLDSLPDAVEPELYAKAPSSPPEAPPEAAPIADAPPQAATQPQRESQSAMGEELDKAIATERAKRAATDGAAPGSGPIKSGAVSTPASADPDALEQGAISQGMERDRLSRLLRGLEMGTKQMTAGVLQQPMAQVVSENTNYEGVARAAAEKGEQKRYSRSQDEIARAHQRAMAERQARLDEKSVADRAEDKKRQAERDIVADREKNEDQSLRGEYNAASLANAKAMQRLSMNADERAAAAREEAAAKAAQGDADRASKNRARVIPYDRGTFILAEGLDDSASNKAREAAGLYNGAFGALDGVKPILSRIATAKTPRELADAKSELAGSVQAAATAANTALGQGAMAEGEKKAMIDAMGADLMTLDGARAFVSNDPSVIRRKLESFRAIIARQAQGRLSAYGTFERPSATAAMPQTPRPPQPQKGGTRVVIRKKDGAKKTLTTEEAKKYEGDPGFEVK